VSHTGDHVVMGMAITMTAAGLSVVLAIAWFAQGGQTPPLPEDVRLKPMLDGAGAAVREVPLVGTIVGIGLLGHNADGRAAGRIHRPGLCSQSFGTAVHQGTMRGW
jgi:ABC-type uncharacterized transport system permease subunit